MAIGEFFGAVGFGGGAAATVSVILSAKDDYSKNLQRFQKEIKETGKVSDQTNNDLLRSSNLLRTVYAGALGVATGAIISFGKSAFTEFQNAKKEMNRLSISFGTDAQRIKNVIDRFALSSNEATGTISDAFVSMNLRLRSSGLGISDQFKLIQAALDLSAAKGVAFQDVAEALAAGIQGNTRALKPFGIAIKEGARGIDAMNQALSQTTVFAGAAEKSIDPLVSLQKEWNQVLEEFGRLISPTVTSFASKVTLGLKELRGFQSSADVQKAIDLQEKALQQLEEELKSREKSFGVLNIGNKIKQKEIDLVKMRIDGLKKQKVAVEEQEKAELGLNAALEKQNILLEDNRDNTKIIRELSKATEESFRKAREVALDAINDIILNQTHLHNFLSKRGGAGGSSFIGASARGAQVTATPEAQAILNRFQGQDLSNIIEMTRGLQGMVGRGEGTPFNLGFAGMQRGRFEALQALGLSEREMNLLIQGVMAQQDIPAFPTEFLTSSSNFARFMTPIGMKTPVGPDRESVVRQMQRAGMGISSTSRVGDALITKRGDIVEFDPADNIMASKQGFGTTIVVNVQGSLIAMDEVTNHVEKALMQNLRSKVSIGVV